MLLNIPHLEWRVLRQVSRTKKPSFGKTLRVEMTRRTKDGSFLTALVNQGLLETVEEGETPFESTYRLTERGKHAAEYGQYEVDWAEYKALSLQANGKA